VCVREVATTDPDSIRLLQWHQSDDTQL